ncbi:MAG: hypothetical protein HQ581_14745 [Planctomycetes bacterium]|nr:hypothetical protein [Planctomycetota bacterium]
MRTPLWRRWMLPATAAVLIACVLGLYRTSAAPPSVPKQPFANSVEQRFEMIKLLREINSELKEQNELLRSGKLKVTVVDPPEE